MKGMIFMKKITSIFLCAFIMLLSFSAVFAEEGEFIEIPSAGYFDITKPLPVKITFEDMVKCTIYIGANEVASGVATDGVFETEADISSVPYIGDVTLKAVATLENGSKFSGVKQIKLVKLTDPISKYSQTFTDLNQEYESASSVALLDMIVFTQGVSTIKPYDRGDGDIALELSYHEPHYSPFMYKAGLGITDSSLIEIYFDVMFSSSEDSFTVNYRYNTSDVPAGRITKYFSGGKLGNSEETYEPGVWYSAKIIVDTYGDGANKFYVKGGDFEDYTLFAESSEFSGNGLNQVRFELSNKSGESYYLDNFEVKYKTILNVCSISPSFVNDSGETDAFNVGVSSPVTGTASERIELIEPIVIKNESGDVIPSTFELSSDALSVSLSPSKTLNFGRKYYLVVPSSAKAESGTKFHVADPFVFYTEKSPNGIEKVLKSSGGIAVYLKNIEALSDNAKIIAVSYNGQQAVDVNSVEVVGEVEYDILLAEGEYYKVYLYEGNSLIDEVEF